MSIFYLHIGSHKTGTSALQTSFAANMAQLAKDGFLYPPSTSNKDARRGLITSGNGLRLAKYLNPKLMFEFDVSTILPQVDRIIDKAAGKNLLYSSEFMESLQRPQLEALKLHLDARGYKIKVLYYARSIAGHALSTYIQAIKRSGISSTFMEYVTGEYRNPFRTTIGRVEATIGRDNFAVFNYDEARADILGHFMRDGLGVDPKPYLSPPQVNRSLSDFEIEFMRLLNASCRDSRRAEQVSDALIFANPDAKTHFAVSQEERRELQARFAKDLDIVNAYVSGEPIELCHSSITIGERTSHKFSEFERAVIAVLGAIAP